MSKANTVCIDFDWTLCSNDKFGKPDEDMVELLKALCENRYEVIIYTSRKEWRTKKLMDQLFGDSYNNESRDGEWKEDRIEKWLKKYELDKYITDIVYGKPEAVVYIDDRALTFKGKRPRNFMSRYYKPVDIIEDLKKESAELLK